MTRGDAVQTRTAGLAPDGDGWHGTVRANALARLTASGLPVRRDEYWRYTDPSDFTATDVLPVPPQFGEAPLFADVSALRVVFTDGVFDVAASDDLHAEGLEIDVLSRAALAEKHWAQDRLGVLEAAGQVPVARPLAALATAFATDGLLIRVTGQPVRPVLIEYRHADAASDVMLHHCVVLEAGASLTLLESGPVGARATLVMEADLAAGARFDHIRVQGPAVARRAATHFFACIADGAAFKSFTLTLNGAMTRNDVVLDLAGHDASAHVAGAAVGDGAFHHDDTVFVTHRGLRCESRQVFKSVLRNGAVGVFQGKILVQQGAQKTDGYQISQALMLDGDSQFLAKPELEIYADDVKCSHGSTSGAIDPGALFYLRSRGVPERTAQSLLVLAFLAQALEEIANASLAERLHAALGHWLGQSAL